MPEAFAKPVSIRPSRALLLSLRAGEIAALGERHDPPPLPAVLAGPEGRFESPHWLAQTSMLRKLGVLDRAHRRSATSWTLPRSSAPKWRASAC